MIGSIIGPIIGLTTPGGGGGPPPAVETRFVSTWDTTQAGSASGTIILPMPAGPLVDWGDGTIDNLTNHDYGSPETEVTIKIDGAVTDWKFNNNPATDLKKLLTIENWGGFAFAGERTFFGCTNLGPILAPDIPLVTHALGLQIAFLFCGEMSSINRIGEWDTSICESFDSMLSDTGMAGVIDLSSWSTSNLIIATNTFKSTDLTSNGMQSWDISGVTSFGGCLQNTTLDTDDYNAMWINFASQSLQSNVPFHGGNSVATGAGLTARNFVISTYSWTVTDAS